MRPHERLPDWRRAAKAASHLRGAIVRLDQLGGRPSVVKSRYALAAASAS